MRPLRTISRDVGGIDRGYPHIGAHPRGQLPAVSNGGLGGSERVEYQKSGSPPGRDVMRQTLLERLAAGQRGHVTHPVLRRGQLLDVVEHALGHPERPRRMTSGRHRHHAHPAGRRAAPAWLGGEQCEGAVLGNEYIFDAVVIGPGALESLHMPAVLEGDLLARDHRHRHLREPFTGPAHLAVVHREEAGADVLGVAGAGAEAPRSGDPVAAGHGSALAVGEELSAHRDAVVVGGEHLSETLVGQIRRGGE